MPIYLYRNDTDACERSLRYCHDDWISLRVLAGYVRKRLLFNVYSYII
jgi:hypothetical protein